jgi:hypothetical protein
MSLLTALKNAALSQTGIIRECNIALEDGLSLSCNLSIAFAASLASLVQSLARRGLWLTHTVCLKDSSFDRVWSTMPKCINAQAC